MALEPTSIAILLGSTGHQLVGKDVTWMPLLHGCFDAGGSTEDNHDQRFFSTAHGEFYGEVRGTKIAENDRIDFHHYQNRKAK